MSDTPEKTPDGIVVVEVGCIRYKSPEQIAREKSPEYMEAELKRIFEKGPPLPPPELE
jgi:hypothetical protein